MPPQENNVPEVNNLIIPPANFTPIPPLANNPVPPKPRGNAFLLVLTFLLILTGIFGVWYFSHPLPDEVEEIVLVDKFSDWKTYKNEEYGFEFKYPADWQLRSSLVNAQNQPPKVSTDGSWSFEPFVEIGNPMSGMNVYPLYIFISLNPKNLNAESYVKDMVASAPKEGPGGIRYYKEFALSVGGQSAYELYSVFAYDQNDEEITITNANLTYTVKFPVSDENPNLSNPKDNNKISHQILSTFKFISTSTPTGISISNLKDGQVVTFPLNIVGSINGNGWAGDEGEAGSVQVFDNNGKAISEVSVLKITTDTLKLPAQFSVTVGDKKMMDNITTAGGVMIFRSAAEKDGQIVNEYKIPIKFK